MNASLSLIAGILLLSAATTAQEMTPEVERLLTTPNALVSRQSSTEPTERAVERSAPASPAAGAKKVSRAKTIKRSRAPAKKIVLKKPAKKK